MRGNSTGLQNFRNSRTLKICRNRKETITIPLNNHCTHEKNTYTIPLALVFSLFFLWAISSNLLPTMIRQLMKTCELNTFEASFTETAYWLAYFIFPIPIAMFMKRYSYKAGIIFGLLLAAVGGLLFFPAAMLKEYWAYLCIFFIIATGMCFLETAANPYVTVLGAPETAPRRLNLAQSFNGLGAFIAAMFLSKLILSGTHYTRETLPVDYPGRLAGLYTTGNGCDETSLSDIGSVASCDSGRICFLKIAEDWR